MKKVLVFLAEGFEEAEALCERVGIIDHGRIIALDEPKRLCERVGSVTVEYMDEGRTVYRHFPDRDEAQAFAATLSTDDEIRIRRTNLEDVFVELTGKSVG